MPISPARIKAIEERLMGSDKGLAQFEFGRNTVCKPPEGQTEEDYIGQLYILWIASGQPKDLKKFSKAIWVRAEEEPKDISAFGLERKKAIEQRGERMYKKVLGILGQKESK